MVASVIIEYSVKSLDKEFDYLIPENIKDELKVGSRVLVPFGNKIIEGFVTLIKSEIKCEFEYKSIINIVNPEFYLSSELLELGNYMSEKTLSTRISCYQSMLPKALKASAKTKDNTLYECYIILNNDIDVVSYIKNNTRRKKENEILNNLSKDKKILKSLINCSSLKNLIEKNIVLEIKEEVSRNVYFTEEEDKNITLNDEQKKAVDNILNNRDKPSLLYGVTGSGKTEVYIEVIKKVLSEGKQAIMLVPEISLTPQIISRFKNVFKENTAVIHSRLSEGEKNDEYRRIFRGNVNVVVGARSAVFSPLKNLGIIIIDECGSSSYKQENNPKYNAIDIAQKRCQYNNAICIMGSATPLLEQYARSIKNVYNLVTLNNRINNSLPIIKIVDMQSEAKKRNFIISDELKNSMNEVLKRHEQVILLLNRRGYSTFMSCSNCGYVEKCPNCDITLTYHKTSNNLRCHYCGYSKVKMNVCPSCHNEAIKDLGMGTEKLEQLISSLFPQYKVIRMDTDTTNGKNKHAKLIEAFSNHEADILVGTQMISKGLNFNDVTLAGIINADASLNIPDFRSGERTFELLMQTSGRSGRALTNGKVIIQTYNPDNYVFKFIKNHNYISFYNYEMDIRRKLKYPPYFYLTSIKVISSDYEVSRDTSNKIKKYLDQSLDDSYTILGPTTANIFKVNNKYNFVILIKYKVEGKLMEVLKSVRDNNTNKSITVDIDINPLNL
ncbi:MAG: primosomal protein N' [Bacilli bacterium]